MLLTIFNQFQDLSYLFRIAILIIIIKKLFLNLKILFFPIKKRIVMKKSEALILHIHLENHLVNINCL